MPAPVVVAEVVRSGFVEGHHHGSVVALDRDGSIAWAVGDADGTMLPRSCNKPLQAAAMLRCGLPLEGDLLALAAASHSGEAFHLEGVRRILRGVGQDESALQTPPDLPVDEQEREDYLRAGGTRSSLAMNCSGKHAAMLATCVVNGWDTAGYLAPDHPLQQSIAGTFAELTGTSVEVVATDGCGAPLLSTSLVGLATAFRTIATATDGPERRVADAIRAFPEFTSGTRRDEAALMHAVPGSVAKAGAESCYALGLADGRAVALKTDDGSARVRPVLMAQALERLGVTSETWVDAPAVRRTGVVQLLGGGRPVGVVRATNWP
jgi:L-asparaginase II